MGADAAVGRHDGTPPREDQIADRMRAEGLSLQGWGNGPCDTYGWHEQGYERCCTACAAGSCSTPPAATSNSARETRWSSRRTPRTRQPSARRACAASERPDSQTRARLTGSATWQTCSMSCRGPGRPSSRQMRMSEPGGLVADRQLVIAGAAARLRLRRLRLHSWSLTYLPKTSLIPGNRQAGNSDTQATPPAFETRPSRLGLSEKRQSLRMSPRDSTPGRMPQC